MIDFFNKTVKWKSSIISSDSPYVSTCITLKFLMRVNKQKVIFIFQNKKFSDLSQVPNKKQKQIRIQSICEK